MLRDLVLWRHCSRAADFQRPVFDKPLDAKFTFDNVTVDADWTQSLTLVPMFSGTQEVRVRRRALLLTPACWWASRAAVCACV